MNEQQIIEMLVEKIRNGEITLEQVPLGWKDKVKQIIEVGE